MEAFSALLVLCAGNSLVTCEFPTQKASKTDFDVALMGVRISCQKKQSNDREFETTWSKSKSKKSKKTLFKVGQCKQTTLALTWSKC